MRIDDREQPHHGLVLSQKSDLAHKPLVRLAIHLGYVDDLQCDRRVAAFTHRLPYHRVAAAAQALTECPRSHTSFLCVGHLPPFSAAMSFAPADIPGIVRPPGVGYRAAGFSSRRLGVMRS